MYQVLYRKYRPKTFSDVSGQQHVTDTLKNQIVSNRLAHAYIFTGSRGTGKTTCAKILAKAVNCLRPVDGDPCCECDICTGVDNGSIFDVVEIDAASNNGVDDIRELREEANFSPAAGKYRVYIIDEAHMLSREADNALLKTLEEPPAHVLFILATTEVHKLPPTILSRCQRFDFRRIDDTDIKERLLFVCGEEGIKITDDAALLVARLADGGLRDALSILDQCVGVSTDIDVDIVNKASGLAGKIYLSQITDAIIARDPSEALTVVDSLHKSGADMERLCDEMISHFRNIMIAKTTKSYKDFIAASEDDARKIYNASQAMSLSKILSSLDLLQVTLNKLHFGLSRRVEMELALISLCNESDTVKPQTSETEAAPVPNELLKRISVLEDMLKNQKASAPQASLQSGVKVKDEPKQVKILIDGVFKEWNEIIDKIRPISTALAVSLKDSIAYVSDNYILIDAKDGYFKELMEYKGNKDSIRQILFDYTGKRYNLGPFKKENAEFKNENPLAELAKAAEEAGIEVDLKQN